MPTLSSLEEARRFSKAAKKLNKTVRAQIKVDTGMGRLGVSETDALQLVHAAAKLPHLEITGIYTACINPTARYCAALGLRKRAFAHLVLRSHAFAFGLILLRCGQRS